MSRRVWLQGQVRTQRRAGIRGPVGKVWPRCISAGVSAEGGRRWECCMKLCPGDRAEACRGTGRLPGLGLGMQTGEERQASPVLQSWSQGGLLMGRQEWGGGGDTTQSKTPSGDRVPGGSLGRGRAGSKALESRSKTEAGGSKVGAASLPGCPGSARPRGHQGRPSPPAREHHAPARGRWARGPRACGAAAGGAGGDAPQWEQPRAVQQAALPAGRTGASPQDSPRAGSRCARPGAVSLCPPNSPAAASSLLCSKYGRGPHKRPHPSAPQRKTGALASPAVPQGHSSSRLTAPTPAPPP